MSTRLESFLAENGLSCWVKFYPEERKWFAEIGVQMDYRCGECSGDSYLGKVSIRTPHPTLVLPEGCLLTEIKPILSNTALGGIQAYLNEIRGKEIVCETEYYSELKTIQVPDDLTV